MIRVNKIASAKESHALRVMGNDNEEELLVVGVTLPRPRMAATFITASVGGSLKVTHIPQPLEDREFMDHTRSIVIEWLTGGSPDLEPQVRKDLDRVMRAVGRHFWIDTK